MKNTIAISNIAVLLLLLSTQSVQAAYSCRTIHSSTKATEFTSKPEVALETTAKPATAIKKNMVSALLDAQLTGIRESRAFKRVAVALEGQFKSVIKNSKDIVKTIISTGKKTNYGGVDYIEFPNSTAMATTDPVSGAQREFMLTRGVKPYIQHMNSETGTISPEGYVSDVLLFERINGKSVFRHRILASKEDSKFFFEDPRISIIYEDGKAHYYLSGTDYSSHRPDSSDPDVMNRYVELQIDDRGLPLPVQVDAQTGKPDFFDISPAPKKTGDHWAFVDAKNGTIAKNEAGEIVVRTRMRPDFGNPVVKEMAGGQTWQYAEQVFTFKNWQHFKEYNWDDALIDLFGKRGQVATASKVAPNVAKVIILDTQLKEHLTSMSPDLEVQVRSKEKPEAKGKGLGPGTRPLRIQRIGNELFVSDGPGAPNVSAGIIPANRLAKFALKDGEVTFLTFDHEIRYVKQKVEGKNLLRRHYSASLKFFDATLTKIISYRPDAIQPKTPHELGLNSGITDLLHVYPMGFIITPEGIVRVFAGASDAHTTIYDFDIMKLMLERETN